MKMESNIFQNIDKDGRDKHPKNVALHGMTHFGYKLVKEKEKAFRVKRHFNIVADKYDLMNTFLSFGIHYIWKRVAVKALNLKRGDFFAGVPETCRSWHQKKLVFRAGSFCLILTVP